MPVSDKGKPDISQSILEHVPKQAEVTRIEFEGPALAVYTKKPEILIEQSYVIADIVNLIRKRIVVRSDPSVRSEEKEAERKVIEAGGQRDAQNIISQSLTSNYLYYLYIQNLKECNGTIYVPLDPNNGLPLFRQVE